MGTIRSSGEGPWVRILRRIRSDRATIIALGTLLLLIVAAVIGPIFASFSYDAINKLDPRVPPLVNGHLLGTDALGRDLLARTMMGLRMSLAIGTMATIVSLIIGVSWGATAGYLGGRTDQIMMRLVDVLYALPFVFFVILLMVVFGRNIFLVFLAIGAVEWLTMARIVRAQAVTLREREFVQAARAAGMSGSGIIRRHIVPNLLGPVIVYATFTIPMVIMAESFLSFLGMGVQEPLTSLGTLISQGAQDMELAPWLLVFPSIVMTVTLVCLNFVGDGLRDAMDPRHS